MIVIKLQLPTTAKLYQNIQSKVTQITCNTKANTQSGLYVKNFDSDLLILLGFSVRLVIRV